MRPVENVTWYDAVYFYNALSEKLGLTKVYTITVTTVDLDNHITAANVTRVANANGWAGTPQKNIPLHTILYARGCFVVISFKGFLIP